MARACMRLALGALALTAHVACAAADDDDDLGVLEVNGEVEKLKGGNGVVTSRDVSYSSIDVTPEQFPRFITHADHVVVVFCDREAECEKLRPELVDARKILGKLRIPIPVGIVDVKKFGPSFEVAKKQGLGKMGAVLPMFRVYKKGKIDDTHESVKRVPSKSGMLSEAEYIAGRVRIAYDPDYEPPADLCFTLNASNWEEKVYKDPATDLTVVLYATEDHVPVLETFGVLAEDLVRVRKFAKVHIKTLVAKVDCGPTKDKAMCDKFGVKAVPVMRTYRKRIYDGKVDEQEFDGELDQSQIAQHLREFVDGVSRDVSKMSEINEELTKDVDKLKELGQTRSSLLATAGNMVLAAFSPDAEMSDEEKAKKAVYHALVPEARDVVVFFHTNSSKIMKHFKLKPGTMNIIRNKKMHLGHASDQIEYELSTKMEDVPAFKTKLNKDILPLVNLLTSHNKDAYFAKTTVFLNVDMPDKSAKNYKNEMKTTSYYFKTLGKAAAMEPAIENVKFCVANCSNERIVDGLMDQGTSHTAMQKYCQQWDLMDQAEASLVMRTVDGFKYRLPFDLDVDPKAIRKFVENSLKPGTKPWIRSTKPIKKKVQKKSASKILTGKTFRKTVLDPKKHVLVSLCPAKDPDCINHLQEFNMLARTVADVKDVLIAVIDPSVNDLVPQVFAKGISKFGSLYPTVYWLPKDNKDKPLIWRAHKDAMGRFEAEDYNMWIKYMSENGAAESLSAGFDPDAPLMIEDPKSLKPAQWDDEDDGEWESQMIKNPEATGWKRKLWAVAKAKKEEL